MSPREEAATVAAALAHLAGQQSPTAAPLALVAAVQTGTKGKRRGLGWHLQNLIGEAFCWLGERSMRRAS